jgi:hypothetical protein
MSTVKEFHRLAMEQADYAHAARREGDTETARVHFEKAFHLERQAAEQLKDRHDAEPSRSILFRSGATLAIEAGDMAEAEQMVCAGLAGTPPAALAEELRDLFEQVTFRRHLALRGVTLAENEIQMSLAGRGVGFGIAPTDEVLDRIGHAQAMLYRFAERRLNKPYRDKGGPPKEIREAVSLFMTVPRAASFAVSLVVGGVQQTLPGLSVGESVIDDVVDCLDMLVRDEENALAERIQDPAYLTNFRALAKAITPDGEQVDTVGFTAVRGGRERTVALKAVQTKPMAVPPFGSQPETETPQRKGEVSVTGMLRFADSMEHREHLIKLLDDNGVKHSVVVPTGMMDDIVRPLWSSRVTVTGVASRSRILLTDIAKARDSSGDE